MSGTILIIDDVATNRIVLKVRLVKACYQVMSVASLADGIEAARMIRPDVILLGLGSASGLGALARLAQDAATAGLPVIALTGAEAAALRAQAIRAGAIDALSRPVDEGRLLARLRHLMRERLQGTPSQALEPVGLAEGAAPYEAPPRPAQVTLIWGDRAQAVSWKHALTGRMSAVPRITSAETALLEAGSDAVADVYLIAADLAQPGDGLRLMADLRARPGTRDAAICIVTASAQVAADALDRGADEVLWPDLASPATLDEVEARLRACLRRRAADQASRDRLAAQLRDAVTDPLTGLANRRVAQAQLARIAAEAAAIGHPYAVLVIDLDRFKTINDSFGHAAGDAVLAGSADCLSRLVPRGALMARLGGEEFVALLPRCDRADAVALAQAMRDDLAAAALRIPSSAGPGLPATVQLTASVGVAIGQPGEDGTTVLNRADRALLASKAAGRNRVTLAVLRAPEPVAPRAPAVPAHEDRVRAFG
ncbi:diguanylate cyclase domain-containing protein [Paracoccus sp. p4-l81]|uniref:diguanylate cyclase domain-containing protein n=1 Tax=Paracoccus sp. p4-l81 TaxID=3342806 RepID=UPI0035BA5DAA